MRDVTDAGFDTKVLAAATPVVVDFWAPWCKPCAAVTAILEQLEAERPELEFVKLDIDVNPLTAARYEVLSIPTVIAFSGGEARETIVGARPRSHYERALSSLP